MSTSTSSQEAVVSREEAAELLNISIRTLDRYIRRNYFEVKKVDRSVWISRPSLERFYDSHSVPTSSDSDSRTEKTGEGEAVVHSTEESLVHSPLQDRIELSAHEHPYSDMNPASIYKSLYEDLKPKYEEQQKRLEGAHYRVGQLEAQVKTMVPLIEFKRERQQTLLLEKQYKESMDKASTQFSRLKSLFEGERLNKNIYMGLVYLLLILHMVFWGILR
jgi:hypothetical protein